ncbi:GMC oxidoreductase [Periconia macrospinosa]|uniref:GMC oxidoreductase n=1 Tax=Periconia macrospinosa TaxID=97972 RepID=A0A2V1DRF6_9PLEO|nr:GMC oxidoreductase [Periconia macrospinosa]
METASNARDFYDYVIVGGGTAGLVLANRLSENQDVTVAVLEAGSDPVSDPRSFIPALWANTFGTELDWNFSTVAQVSLDGRRIGHHQGKALGGSSSINAQALITFTAADIDVWEAKIGLEGWNFAVLAPYLQKVFNLTLPADELISYINASWATSWVTGSEGPVKSCFSDVQVNPTPKAWIETFRSLGMSLTASPFSGKYLGAFISPATIDTRSSTRSAATTYLSASADRKNLAIFTGVMVKKILLENRKGVQTATGVQYVHEGIERTLDAKEVIVSAGALNSPKILELSGIGDPAVLKRAGIPLVVENKFVGTNLQDHLLSGISFEAADGIFTVDNFLRGDAEAIGAAQQQYMENRTGPFASSGLTHFAHLPTMDFKQDNEALSKILKQLEETHPTSSHPLDTVRAHHLSEFLSQGQEGTAQYFLLAGQYQKAGDNSTEGFVPHPQPGNFLSTLVGLSHPLSTGSVHVSSSDYTVAPTVDHNYLSNPVDLELHARHVRYIETIAQTEPFMSLLKPGGRRNDPLSYFEGSLDKAKAYVRATSDTNYHSVGTLAMAPKDMGGVIDGCFRVYGVDQLRVVDASVFPLIPQSNTQSLVYVIAERAADLIKRG